MKNKIIKNKRTEPINILEITYFILLGAGLINVNVWMVINFLFTDMPIKSITGFSLFWGVICVFSMIVLAISGVIQIGDSNR